MHALIINEALSMYRLYARHNGLVAGDAAIDQFNQAVAANGQTRVVRDDDKAGAALFVNAAQQCKDIR